MQLKYRITIWLNKNKNKNLFIFISLFVIFIIYIIYILYTYKFFYKDKIESFGDYHEFINIPQSMCYYDNVKNEIDKKYDLGDLQHDLINCIDYINPGSCIPNNLTKQLDYIENNISPGYYDESVNAAFSCACSKLMNIQYSGVDSKNKKILDKIQKVKNLNINNS